MAMEQSGQESQQEAASSAESSIDGVCPYCGSACGKALKCGRCRGLFDPLSRQASQNAMGPWSIRDEAAPFRPGCSYETLKEMILKERVTESTVIRGPTTRQFWTLASQVPSVANLLGQCHNCHTQVNPDEYMCGSCGAVFSPEADRQHLGLAPVHLLPGQASPEIVAASTVGPGAFGHAGASAGGASSEVPESPLALAILKRVVNRQRNVIIGLGALVFILATAFGVVLLRG